MVAQLLEVFRLLDTQLLDEQAILVPKISCSSCPSRSRVPEPQSAEQLVEVPTVLTPTRIALQIAEQIVDTSLEEDEDSSDELLEYFCEDCVFLEVWNYEWQSLGSGVARLVRQHSDGAFQFWQSERLIIADFVHPRIVLRPARGGGGCIFTWSDPEVADGPSDYLHAVRFAGAGPQVPRCVGGHGVRAWHPLTPSWVPFADSLRSCRSSTSSSTSLSCRKCRFSWSRLFSRLQSFHSCSTFQVLDVPVVLDVLCSQCACPQLQLRSPS